MLKAVKVAQQGEQQVSGEFGADRPGRMVPGQRIGQPPVLHQQEMQRQFAQRIARRRATNRSRSAHGWRGRSHGSAIR